MYFSLKKYLDENVNNDIAGSQKYVAGRQEYSMFLCSLDEFDVESVLEQLSELRENYSSEIEVWSEFGLETGNMDHDVTC